MRDVISTGYRHELERQHKMMDGWGTTAAKYAGGEVFNVIRTNPQTQTLLDYGAGKQALGRFVAEFFPQIQYTGYDPGVPEISKRPEGRYDLVTCIDVLEHIEKEFVENCIVEMAALTRMTLLLDIACYPTSKKFDEGPHKGKDLHITLLTPQEWHDWVVELLDTDFLVRKYSPCYFNGIGDAPRRDRCLMVLDRKY